MGFSDFSSANRNDIINRGSGAETQPQLDQLRQNRQEVERRNVTRMVNDGQWIMSQEVDLKQILGTVYFHGYQCYMAINMEKTYK